MELTETVTLLEIVFTTGAFIGMWFFLGIYMDTRKDDVARKLAHRFGEDYDLIIKSAAFRSTAGFIIMLFFFMAGLYSFSVPQLTKVSPGAVAFIVAELLMVAASGYDLHVRRVMLRH